MQRVPIHLSACAHHLHPEERETWRANRTALNGTDHAARQRWLDATPYCWRIPVTPDDRDLIGQYRMAGLAIWQRHRCAICGLARSLVIDHDHQTGLVRGLLCRSCNVAEGGNLRPEGTVFSRYRYRNPASVLELVEVYYSPVTGLAKPTDQRPLDPWQDPMTGVL